MKQPQPIIVVDLFPEILEKLLALLSDLSADDWARPTACSHWSVKDVALHLLGDDVHILSWQRDNHSSAASAASWEELVTFINTVATLGAAIGVPRDICRYTPHRLDWSFP